MTPDDPILMAYADGQLQGEDAARVEAAIAADPRLAAVVREHQAMRQLLREAYAPVLDEPVPSRLREAAAGDAGRPAGVTPLPPRAARPQPPRQTLRARLALAAMLVVGLALGLLLGRPEASPFARDDAGHWVARGELAEALGRQLAAEEGGAVGIGLSFRDDRGQWCRSFHFRDGTALAGLACHDQEAWRIAVLAEAETPGGELVQAGAAIPPTVLAAIDARLAGEPLDADQERAARDAGWR